MNTEQKLEYVMNVLVKLKDAEAELRTRHGVPVDQYFQGKIDEWANKILGVTSGYDSEFKQMYKHRIEKFRILVSGHSDVTVGEPDDIHAKSIQLKSTTCDHSQVSTMIKAALNQLSGERGEGPRPMDRLVVDISILDANNTWPGGAGTLGTYNWPQFEQTAKEKLLKLCSESSHRQHESSRKPGYGLSPTTRAHLTDLQQVRQTFRLSKFDLLDHPHSTQLIASVAGRHPSAGDKVIHLTVKIRYVFGYPIVTGKDLKTNTTTTKFLHLAVFNVFRLGDRLGIKLAKAIEFSETGFTRAQF